MKGLNHIQTLSSLFRLLNFKDSATFDDFKLNYDFL